MHRVSFLTEVATPYVMSDVNLRALPDIEPLAQGPMMLQRYSLLTRGSELEVKFRGTPMFLQDHRFLQMIIGSRGSYTAPHYDWFGMDAYLQLIEGEKIWWAAPPSSEPAFRRLFDDTNVNVTRQSKEASDQLQAMGGFAIHQRAGDMVFMPGGWIHCVKNLSYTVSFGGSYLRAWNLPLTIRYLTSTEKQNAHLINLSDVLDRLQTNDQKLTGIDDDEASMVRRIYEANKPRFHKYLRHASVEKYGTLLSIFAAASSQPSTSTTSSGRARTPTARARAATLVSSSRTKPSTASKRKKPDG